MKSSTCSSSDSCRSCTPGKYQLWCTCILCPEGFHTDGFKFTGCVDCRAARYSANYLDAAGKQGATVCGSCKAGTYSLTQKSSCTACPLGKSSHGCSSTTEDARQCDDARLSVNLDEIFNDDRGGNEQILITDCDYRGGCAGECIECFPGTYTNTTGAKYCNVCPVNFYAHRGSSRCEPCPANSQSPQMSGDITNCQCNAGYTSVDVDEKIRCTPCVAGKYKPQSGSAACITCPEGSFAVAGKTGSTICSTCPRGTHLEDGENGTQCVNTTIDTTVDVGQPVVFGLSGVALAICACCACCQIQKRRLVAKSKNEGAGEKLKTARWRAEVRRKEFATRHARQEERDRRAEERKTRSVEKKKLETGKEARKAMFSSRSSSRPRFVRAAGSDQALTTLTSCDKASGTATISCTVDSLNLSQDTLQFSESGPAARASAIECASIVDTSDVEIRPSPSGATLINREPEGHGKEPICVTAKTEAVPAEVKYQCGKLILGKSADSVLTTFLGMDDVMLGNALVDPMDTLEREWFPFGFYPLEEEPVDDFDHEYLQGMLEVKELRGANKIGEDELIAEQERLFDEFQTRKHKWWIAGANFDYVRYGTVGDFDHSEDFWVPPQVLMSFQTGVYHGGPISAGDYDSGLYDPPTLMLELDLDYEYIGSVDNGIENKTRKEFNLMLSRDLAHASSPAASADDFAILGHSPKPHEKSRAIVMVIIRDRAADKRGPDRWWQIATGLCEQSQDGTSKLFDGHVTQLIVSLQIKNARSRANMTLVDFTKHEISQLAGLEEHHVFAMRIYTSDAFPFFNNPMRQRVKPHPLMVTMYFLDQALKMLTTVEAKLRPAEYNKIKYLWRGMRNMTLDADLFFQEGGTELVSSGACENTHTRTWMDAHTKDS